MFDFFRLGASDTQNSNALNFNAKKFKSCWSYSSWFHVDSFCFAWNLPGILGLKFSHFLILRKIFVIVMRILTENCTSCKYFLCFKECFRFKGGHLAENRTMQINLNFKGLLKRGLDLAVNSYHAKPKWKSASLNWL